MSNERNEQWKEMNEEKDELLKHSKDLQEAIERNRFHIVNHNLSPEQRQEFSDNADALLKEKTNVDVRVKNLDRRSNHHKKDAVKKAVYALKIRNNR